MCDYSLHTMKNRLAQKDERLVLHRFRTGSKGFASAEDAGLCSGFSIWKPQTWRMAYLDPEVQCAVCLPPGATLTLEDIPQEIQDNYRVSARELVTFQQLSNDPFRYRDAVVFRSGAKLLLQKLPEGVKATVLCLGQVEEQALEPMAVAWIDRAQYARP